MWTTLRKIEISARFIFWVQLLYAETHIKIFINDFLSEKITIKCEVRQSDSLNCFFFIVIIKELVCYILADDRIQKIMIDDQILKFTMYVDDIAIVCRT